MTVCARSWRGEPIPPLIRAAWYWCDRERGHPGKCACMGLEPPPTAIFFEDDLEAQADLVKERLDEQKMIAKKECKKSGLTLGG